MSGRPWTPEEDAILRANADGRRSAKQIADLLPTSRTQDSVGKRMNDLGLPSRLRGLTLNNELWTPEEDAILRAKNGVLSAPVLASTLLPGRSPAAIIHRRRALGLATKGGAEPLAPTLIGKPEPAPVSEPALRVLSPHSRRSSDWRLAIVSINEVLKIAIDQGAGHVAARWSQSQRGRVLASLDDLICRLQELRSELAHERPRFGKG